MLELQLLLCGCVVSVTPGGGGSRHLVTVPPGVGGNRRCWGMDMGGGGDASRGW